MTNLNSPTVDQYAIDGATQWQVTVDENQRLHMYKTKGKKEEELFVDAAWGLLIFRKGFDDIGDAHFHYANRRPATLIGSSLERIIFASDGYKKTATYVVDGKIISPDKILRAGFYARTDAGTLLASICPDFDKDARSMVLIFSKKRKFNFVLQHLSVNWLMEIFPKMK